MSQRSGAGQAVARVVSGRLEVLAAAALFSVGGAAIKSISLTPWQVASFRSGVAALTLAILLPRGLRNWSWRTLLVGAAYAATMILYVQSNRLTTAANTIFLQDTAPLYVLLLSPLLLGERIQSRDLAFLAAMAVGMALIFLGHDRAVASAPNPATGNLLAAVSGLTWALTVLGLRWLGRHPETGRQAGLAAAIAGSVIASLVCLPMALPLGPSKPLDWGLILFLGIFQIGFAYFLLTKGIGAVPAFEASLLLLLEPVLNPLWAWWIEGERPSRLALVGGAAILVATMWKTVVGRRKRRSQTISDSTAGQ